MKNVLAVDMGSSGVKIILGTYSDNKITTKEIHRFSHVPIYENNNLKWDFENIISGVIEGIKKAIKLFDVDSIAIDSWAVDFVSLDKDFNILETPFCYRDERTKDMLKYSEKFIPLKDLYLNSGCQILNINTIFQLLAMRRDEEEIFNKVNKIMLLPDYINYLLTGVMASEETNASTTALFNHDKKDFSDFLFKSYGLNKELFPAVSHPGMILGKIKKELNMGEKDVVLIASHDTASAVVSVPSQMKEYMYISLGSWSIMGMNLEKAIINNETYKYNLTNETGFLNTERFQKNITGLFLMQELKRYFNENNIAFDFKDMSLIAEKESVSEIFIDPDCELFSGCFNIVSNINKYLLKTNQRQFKNNNELIRMIYDSLALKHKMVYNMLKDVSKKDFDVINVIGGGIRDEFLISTLASALNKKIIAGPTDGTALGNIAMQLYASGDIKDFKKVIINSVETKTYEPCNPEIYDNLYEKYISIINRY